MQGLVRAVVASIVVIGLLVAVGIFFSQADSDASAPTIGYDLSVVLVFALFGIAFVVVTVACISRLLRPNSRPEDEPAKEETYECGEPAIGSSWVRFDIRFYTVALIFLIFDVEVAFLFPWAVIFKALRKADAGLFVFLEMLVFIAILLVGFIYCWKKGDMDWVKSKGSQDEVVVAGPVQVAEASVTQKEVAAVR